jgi:MoxR-like ATPase
MTLALDTHVVETTADAPLWPASIEQVLFEIKRLIVGQDYTLERLLIALLARGHVLLEGVPGLAKTAMIKSLAEVVGGTFGRVQFTPDLVPADLTGTRIYNGRTSEFTTELGPIFVNLLLADELNRAPAKVQSALLEVMQERQVTIGKQTYAVPNPFLVLATQNPIESDGTYPLPEAQLDRFMFKVLVDYPTYDDELVVIQRDRQLRERFQRAALAQDQAIGAALAHYGVDQLLLRTDESLLPAVISFVEQRRRRRVQGARSATGALRGTAQA